MKSTPRPKPKATGADAPLHEYRFDYAKSKPNRFAQRARPGSVAVVLDPDVARVFQTAESVNAVLRALVTTMPVHRGSSRAVNGGSEHGIRGRLCIVG